MITSLQPSEVFVFGSNRDGFHGAGGAGLACRGDAGNTWRNDSWFLKAMKAPVGSTDRIGKWAVYGVARGFQEGREGKSYAIVTVTRPGAKRSIPLEDIFGQLQDLWKFAAEHPELSFVISPIGEGYAGYSRTEMDSLWERLPKMPNIKFVREERNIT